LTQTAAYTAFDEHNHVDVGKQFKIDVYFNIVSYVKPGRI